MTSALLTTTSARGSRIRTTSARALPRLRRSHAAAPPSDEHTRIATRRPTAPLANAGAPDRHVTASATTPLQHPRPRARRPHASKSGPRSASSRSSISSAKALRIGLPRLRSSLDRKVALKSTCPRSSRRAKAEQGHALRPPRRDLCGGPRSFHKGTAARPVSTITPSSRFYRFWEATARPTWSCRSTGITLKRALKDLGTPPDEAWLRALLAHHPDALEIIHGLQCYHRDIAPTIS